MSTNLLLAELLCSNIGDHYNLAVRRRIKIIANPISGRGRARRLAERVSEGLRALGCQVTVVQTQKAGDARRLAGDGKDE